MLAPADGIQIWGQIGMHFAWRHCGPLHSAPGPIHRHPSRPRSSPQHRCQGWSEGAGQHRANVGGAASARHRLHAGSSLKPGGCTGQGQPCLEGLPCTHFGHSAARRLSCCFPFCSWGNAPSLGLSQFSSTRIPAQGSRGTLGLCLCALATI